jgi:hypothetical protein
MDVFSIAIIISVVCGLSMVIGGIFLIYKGAMTLAATAAADAITIEFKKQFRLHSQVPGLAFFIVGLLFIIVALLFCRPPRPIDLGGILEGASGPVTIVVSSQSWPLPPQSAAEIRGRITPDITYLVIEAVSPGCTPIQELVDTRNVKGGKVQIPKLHFIRKVDEVTSNPANISSVPFALPGMNAPPSYGVAK